jgi:predicted ferric reductase
MITQIAFLKIFGLTVFSWLGILALILFIIAAISGNKGASIKRHRLIATIAIILALLHVLISFSKYFQYGYY